MRVEELNIETIVDATTHGGTAMEVKNAFNDSKYRIVAVSIAEGFSMREG
jgi:hypothetical protein